MKPPPKAKAIERLQKALRGLPELDSESLDSPAFEKWRRDTEIAITHTFGEKSRHLVDFRNIRYGLQVAFSGTPDSAFKRAYLDGLRSAKAVLQSMVEEVQDYWPEEILSTSPAAPVVSAKTRKVFIIHGHDDGAKETVARFLMKLELNPIILHEQANEGRTIIKKFEDHAEVAAYAIALLTPDDIGAARSEPEKFRDRPRQNVLFEFGFFIGRLGRKHVWGLKKGNVELPSDYSGVAYISLDNGEWRSELIRELKAAGIEVDANLAF